MSEAASDGVVLLAVAAPAEARAVLRGLGGDESLVGEAWRLHRVCPGFDVVVTGIGKANAAGAVGRVLDPSRHRAVVSIGVAGVLPGVEGGVGGAGGVGLGSVVVADACVFADEGLETGEGAEGWRDCAAMGFPLGPAPVEGARVVVPRWLVEELRRAGEAAGGSVVVGGVATVSTCSGTDRLARRVRERTGAVAEGMEGAAVALVGARVGVAAGEVRVISNTTGERGGQVWDLRGALERLAAVCRGWSRK